MGNNRTLVIFTKNNRVNKNPSRREYTTLEYKVSLTTTNNHKPQMMAIRMLDMEL